MPVAPELQPALLVLRRAFPDGVPAEEYKPLLVVLSDGFSERQLARLVAEFTGRDRFVVDNEHAAVRSHDRQDSAVVQRVRQRLNDAGYADLPE